MRFFQRYADFFESAADGMLVVDHQGRILFSNPRASEITGYAPSELSLANVLGFLTRRQVARLAPIVRGFRDGVYPRGVDVGFIPKEARATLSKELTLNVTFSPVLRAERAVLCAFRDVSVEVLQTIEARNADKLFDVGGELDTTCENCHRQYWYPNEKIPDLPAQAGAETP